MKTVQEAIDQLEKLDARMGEGVGCVRERTKLQAIIDKGSLVFAVKKNMEQISMPEDLGVDSAKPPKKKMPSKERRTIGNKKVSK